MSQHKFIVTIDAADCRVDSYLARELSNFTRSQIQGIIKSGNLFCDGKQVAASHKVKPGQKLILNIPKPKPSTIIAQNIDIEILYSDKDIVVVNKPAGMVVHPGAGNHEGTLVNALLYHFPDMVVGDQERPGIVHRLDKETSGVMVCARNHAAHIYLTECFKARSVKKVYRAFCVGSFNNDQFELVTPHARHPTNRIKYTTKVPPQKLESAGVRQAHSNFKVLASRGGVSEVEVTLLTGRTHQIRVQLADVGHPLLGDVLYGGVSAQKNIKGSLVRDVVASLKRHALHAEVLAFCHPTKHEIVEFVAQLPLDLQRIHDVLNL